MTSSIEELRSTLRFIKCYSGWWKDEFEEDLEIGLDSLTNAEKISRWSIEILNADD